ncbi:MAG TPA: beta-N-acetylhexosaminidase [Terriglobales bacterium]|nr:beta-N-acetylhexosaminidase [Terriglobales bacterium]
MRVRTFIILLSLLLGLVVSLGTSVTAQGPQQSLAAQNPIQPAPAQAPAQQPSPQTVPAAASPQQQQQQPRELPVSNSISEVAPSPSSANDLRIIPVPREIERGDGVFPISAATRIVLNSKHAKEDRVAAEVIRDEIDSATGHKPVIATAAVAPAGAVIYLARSGDDRALAAKLKIGSDFDEQGYVLQSEKSRVVISARTGQGLFYGAQTLRQLIQPHCKAGLLCNEELRFIVPAVRIRDWPEMKWRGVHDDISRGPVPNMEFIKQQIRTEAEYKLNMHSLYIEHVFDYVQNPLIGPQEGSLTPEQIKEIVDYGKRYYVTILPEQQAFGHLHHVLKWEIYDELAETPHGHVLTPTNPKTYDFIKSLYSELVPLFPAPFFHIGSDETFELGTGRTKELAEQEGLGRVYLDHLQKIQALIAPYHKRLMFWGDIARKYPELLSTLPKDMIAVPWDYAPRPNFDSYLQVFKNAGLDTFVSPGANNWNQIWPNFDAAFVNIRNFVRDGQKFGSIGMLNTTWDDDGEALFGMTWPAIVLGGACSWQQGQCDVQRFLDDYDWAFYRNASDHTFRDIIAKLTRTHTLMQQARLGSANDGAFWLDPFSLAGATAALRLQPVAHDLRMAAETALVSLYQNSSKARLHVDSLPYMEFAGLRLDMLGMKAQFVKEMDDFYWDAFESQSDRQRVGHDLGEITGTNARLQDLRDTTTRLGEKYRALWLSENRPYWLDNVMARYDLLAQEFQQKINALAAARGSGGLPKPEEIGFFHVEAQAPPAQPNQMQAPPAKPPLTE